MKEELQEYRRKRNFKKTKEPKGKRRDGKNKLTFVVQEHHARRLHYDFRLELNGVLKSWAVPKGPSLNPKDKRLAVQTEDHPLEYAQFEGTIPEGEYGAGEVFIWDEGTWEPEVEDPEVALEKGELKFKLKGEKLKGSFVLVRTSYLGNTKKNWLLIKHQEKRVSKKKIKMGNDPWPGFIHPELPKLVTTVPEGDEWFHEMKFDGYRIEGQLRDGIGHFYTRTGLDWSRSFPHLLNALEKLEVQEAIFDGEIVAFDEEGKTNFQKLQNSIKGKNDLHLAYYIFDLLYLNGLDLRSLPLAERKKKLRKILQSSPGGIRYCEHISKDGKAFYEVSCEHKLEGIVSKMADAPYTSGRNDLWVKIKCSMRQEFVIGGWTAPRGTRVGMGALLLGVYEKGKLRYVGKVGTGFDQVTLGSLRKELGSLEIDETPFSLNSPTPKNVHWVKSIKTCEVSFGNWTDEGILRAAVFQGIREDKPAKEIHRESAMVSLVKDISSPTKILFHEDHKTKQDVADFYRLISKQMIPYLEERPLSVVRCPNGARGTCFYQKHFQGNMPESFHPFPVKEDGGEGIYIAINSMEGLLELVQLNAFEIHAWNCHKDNHLRPDQIVMDLDPGPDVSWKTVVEAAIELKNLLLDLELDSFVKLTGGKGIHIHIPIDPLYDWDQIKSFSQTLALELVSRNPTLYTANMSKRVRKKKIFIDYLRNGYGATAVVPYSLRAKDKSAVAMPLEWKELKKTKASDEFSMEKALKKIKERKRDPWEGMREIHQRIKILRPAKKKMAA